MNASPGQDKFRTYRARKKAAGLREFRMWAPDIQTAGFRRALGVQIARINAAEDECDTLIFCERAAAGTWTDLD